MSADGAIRAELDGGVLHLTIERPERANTLTPDLATELRERLDAVAGAPEVRVVLVRGAGERAFCGGFDLARVEAGERGTGLPQLLAALERCPVPVVAVLNGHAVGAGLELACGCDLRLARAGARVGLPAVQLGIAYRTDGLKRVLTAAPAARRLLLTGEQLPVEDVPGLADAIVAADLLDETAADWSRALAAAAPRALSYTVRALRALEDGAAPALGVERDAIMSGPDVDEALAARREKRPPAFLPREPR